MQCRDLSLFIKKSVLVNGDFGLQGSRMVIDSLTFVDFNLSAACDNCIIKNLMCK